MREEKTQEELRETEANKKETGAILKVFQQYQPRETHRSKKPEKKNNNEEKFKTQNVHESEKDMAMIKIRVPEKAIGVIIGKRGCQIRDIQSRNDTKIISPELGENEFKVTGPEQNIKQVAKEMKRIL